MSGNYSFTQRTLIFFFSIGLVVISASMLRADTHRKQRNQQLSLDESSAKLLRELRGDVDVAKASASPDYLKEVVDNRHLREEAGAENPQLRRSLKDSVMNMVARVMPAAEQK
jgi:hypothetical protein